MKQTEIVVSSSSSQRIKQTEIAVLPSSSQRMKQRKIVVSPFTSWRMKQTEIAVSPLLFTENETNIDSSNTLDPNDKTNRYVIHHFFSNQFAITL